MLLTKKDNFLIRAFRATANLTCATGRLAHECRDTVFYGLLILGARLYYTHTGQLGPAEAAVSYAATAWELRRYKSWSNAEKRGQLINDIAPHRNVDTLIRSTVIVLLSVSALDAELSFAKSSFKFIANASNILQYVCGAVIGYTCLHVGPGELLKSYRYMWDNWPDNTKGSGTTEAGDSIPQQAATPFNRSRNNDVLKLAM